METGNHMEQTRPTVQELYMARSIHAEAKVWTPRMLVALVKGVKGGVWFSLIDKVCRRTTLELACDAVCRNNGAAGVDKLSVERFKGHREEYLDELCEELKTGRYAPLPVRRVEIPKGKGQTRPLGIPAVKDRIAQKAVQIVIEPIFENQFLDMSYGFRPGRGAMGALKEVEKNLKEGYTHVVDADIKGYFDNIPHDKLMDRVKGSIADGKVLALLDSWLNQDIMTEAERWKPTMGTPQGAVISPLLANIYLHPLDCLMTSKGFKMVRYADDFVIMCKERHKANEALEMVKRWVEENGLTLHPDKIHVGDCMVAGEGFEFLGYKFEAGSKDIRKKSLLKLRERLRPLTKRNNPKSLGDLLAAINRILSGWYNYFKYIRASSFKAIDGFIRRRLRAMLVRRNKSKGFGKSYALHVKWPNAFFAKEGYLSLEQRAKKERKVIQSKSGQKRLF
jgi:RNA-directed DNA polymerase